MIIDVNADRCIYTDNKGREYEITPDSNHFYDGIPFAIEMSDQISINCSGIRFKYPTGNLAVHKNVGSATEDGYCINNLNVRVDIPNTDQRLEYSWDIGFDGEPCLYPKSNR